MPSIDASTQPGDHAGKLTVWRKWALGTGLLLSLTCLYFFTLRAVGVWGSVQILNRAVMPGVAVAMTLLLLSYCLAAYVWRALVRIQHIDVSARIAITTLFTTQLCKYLPGNIGQHIGRVALARRYGVPASTSVMAMLAETALILGFMLLLSFQVVVRYVDLRWVLYGALAVLLMGVVIWTAFPRIKAETAMLFGCLAAKRGVTQLALALMLSLACALIYGCVILPLHPNFRDDMVVVTYVSSTFCAAWVAGFLVPGAPAGLGIREWILSSGLAPVIGLEGATVVALLLRIVTTIADLAAFGIGLILLAKAGQTVCRPRPV